MRFAAGSVQISHPVQIFGRQDEAGKRMAWIYQATEGVSRCRFIGEDARCVQRRGCLRLVTFRRAIGLKEEIIVVELPPGQSFMLVGGTCGDGHNMQVVTQANGMACSLQLLNERSRSISAVNTQGDQPGRLQCEPHSYGARLGTT